MTESEVASGSLQAMADRDLEPLWKEIAEKKTE